MRGWIVEMERWRERKEGGEGDRKGREDGRKMEEGTGREEGGQGKRKVDREGARRRGREVQMERGR